MHAKFLQNPTGPMVTDIHFKYYGILLCHPPLLTDLDKISLKQVFLTEIGNTGLDT